MPPRSFWKGYLKLSLVTCPVAMTPATTQTGRVRFHTLNKATGNRIASRYVDTGTGEVVDEDEQVKGYVRGENDHVMLEDEDLASVALETTRTIDIEQFVPRDSIEWIWHDKPHYLMPDDPVGEEAFTVIRTAMEATRTAGIARLVLYRRERAVMLVPRDRGIVLWTLRYGDEVRDPADYFGRLKKDKVQDELLDLALSLIKERTRPWQDEMVHDPVQQRLQEIIALKKKGGSRGVKKPKEADTPTNVVNIMDALRRSIAAETKGKKPH